MRAAVHHSVEFASKLIHAGADINAMDNKRDTALHLAIWKRNLTMVKLILSTPSVQFGRLAETRLRYETAVIRAAACGSGEITDLLIQDKANNQVLGFFQKVALAVTDNDENSEIDKACSSDTSVSIHTFARRPISPSPLGSSIDWLEHQTETLNPPTNHRENSPTPWQRSRTLSECPSLFQNEDVCSPELQDGPMWPHVEESALTLGQLDPDLFNADCDTEGVSG